MPRRHCGAPPWTTTAAVPSTVTTATVGTNMSDFVSPHDSKTSTILALLILPTSIRERRFKMEANGTDKKRTPEMKTPSEGDRTHSSTKERTRQEEPDVIVVVGEKEFRLYRQVLCVASAYFDAALNSGMKSAQSSRIEFPDKDPQEWVLFYSFLEPFSQAQVTEANVEALVPWFHEFGIVNMLSVCDKVMSRTISKYPITPAAKLFYSGPKYPKESFKRLLASYSFSSLYEMAKTKKTAETTLIWFLDEFPTLLDLECLVYLVSVLKQYEGHKGLVWKATKKHLPEELKAQKRKSLLSNELLPYLLQANMRVVTEQREEAYSA